MSVCNTVQSLWIGPSLSRTQLLCINSFLHHGHEFHLYTYEDVAHVPKGTTIKDANEILPSSEIFTYSHGFGKGSYAGFADMFRFNLLFQKGGWWVDMDMVCLRPFDQEADHVFAQEWGSQGLGVNVNVIKAPPGSEVMGACVEALKEMDMQAVKWAESGPILLTNTVKEHGLTSCVAPWWVFCPINWEDYRRIVQPRSRVWVSNARRLVARDIPLIRLRPGTYGLHIWNEMWRSGDLKGRTAFPPSSFYERLARKYGVA